MNTSGKQLHIRLPFTVFSQLKVKCASDVISMQDYVAKLIETSIRGEDKHRHSGDEQKTTKSYILKLIRGFPLFHNVNENELVKIARATIVLHFKKREIIARENETINSFYIVQKGTVKIFKNSPSGKEFIIDFRGEGETIAPNSVIEGIPNFASAMVLDDTSILSIRRDDFIRFIERNPAVKSRIADLDKKTIDDFYDKIIDLTTNKTEYRLTKVLNSLCIKFGKTLCFTHEEIAGISLTTVETTTRFFNQLKNRHVITISRGKITILDVEKLRV